MKDAEVIARLKAVLQPRGTADIVGLSFRQYTSEAYFSTPYVQECIADMERILLATAAGLHKVTALEKLAFQLLLDSAYIELPKIEQSSVQPAAIDL